MSETSNIDNTTGGYAALDPPDKEQETPYLPPRAPAAVPKKKTGWLWLLLILFIIAAASSYFAYQLWQQLESNQVQQSAQAQHSNAASDALQQDLRALQQQMQTSGPQQVELRQQVKHLEQQQQALQQAYTQLYNRTRRTGDADDWSIAEVGYLLRIAQQRLSLGHDLPAALQALTAADQRLRSAGALLLPVREQLAKDIQQLQSLEMPDIEGMSLRLAGYAQAAEELPLLQGRRAEQPVQQKTPQTPQVQAASVHWRDIIATLWGEMRKLVVIRYNESADTGLLSPSQRAFLSDNVRVKLETARLLLLNRNTEQFHLEIKTVREWMQRYYDTQNKAVTLMRNDLQEMREIELDPEMPDISKTLAVLAQINRAASHHGPTYLIPDDTQVMP